MSTLARLRRFLALFGRSDRELTHAYADGRDDEREEWMPLVAAMTALVGMCEEHGDFSNGVTDPTGTIDEGDVRAGEIICAARAALNELTRVSEPKSPNGAA